ncbi:MAG: choice-of-anchor D domain-containing protein, partial [Acidobacteriota bacterium]
LWAKQGGGISIDEGRGIAVDANGNSYITGYYLYSGQFDNNLLSNYGDRDIFIAKYDGNGNNVWARHAGSSSLDYGNSIGVDAAGYTYLTGFVNGTAKFGTTQIGGSGGYDTYIARYDPAGELMWVKSPGCSGLDEGRGIGVDAGGNTLVTGYFRGTINFNGTVLSNGGDRDIFMAKYDGNGTCLWAKQATGSGDQTGSGAGVGVTGSGYFVGGYTGPITIGTVQLPSSGVYVAKMGEAIIPKVFITSPNGGEIWKTYSTHNITWNSNFTGYIKIELSQDNGASWIPIVNSIVATKGNYTFTVPPFASSPNCLVKLSVVGGTYSSISAAPFTITSDDVPNIVVNTPNTNVRWNGGSVHSINWTVSGAVQNVKIEYTTDNGTAWKLVKASAPASDQSFQWTVPSDASTQCRVRVSDAANAALNDVSDELFTITNLSLTSPMAGEKIKAGSVKNIQWTAGGISTVNLAYSLNSGQTWTTIATNIAASGQTYAWTVPQSISSSCLIKITDQSDPTLIDVMDSVFTIWQVVTVAQTPGMGQAVLTLGATNVTFSAFVITPGSLELSYYSGEGPAAGALPKTASTVSDYYWSVNAPQLTYMNGKVSIPVGALSNVINSAKLTWLKRNASSETWVNIGGIVKDGALTSTVPFTGFKELAIGVVSPPSLTVNAFINIGTSKMSLAKDTTFVISNEGGDTLRIGTIQSSDSAFTVTSSSAVLAGGESFTDTLRFMPRAFGQVNAVIRISSNDAGGMDSIRISGSSPYPFLSTNLSTILFGEVPRNVASKATLILSNSSLNILKVTNVYTNTGAFSVSKTSLTIPQKDSLAITFVPVVNGVILDTLFLVNNSQQSVVKIPLSGSSPQPQLAASAVSVVFADVRKNDSSKSTITLYNRSINPLVLASVSSGTSAFTVSPTTAKEIKANDSLIISLVFSPGSLGISSDTLTINSDGGTLRIPMKGTSPYPVFTAPGMLNFGNVLRTSVKTLQLSIVNSSINDLVIDSMICRGKQFSNAVVGGLRPVKKGDTLKVMVTFAPDSLRQYSDTLFFFSNAQTRIEKITLIGGGVLTGIDRNELTVPARYALMQNYPNPFNPSTVIGFSLPVESQVQLKIYDMVGRELQTLVDDKLSAGCYSLTFNAGKLSSGMYIYRLIAVDRENKNQTRYSETRRFLLMK